ncbi:MAG: hypothetical protein IKD89_08300 [Clostridia bacterium]|nr:hypothetical protein [Clostridia bacterium]
MRKLSAYEMYLSKLRRSYGWDKAPRWIAEAGWLLFDAKRELMNQCSGWGFPEAVWASLPGLKERIDPEDFPPEIREYVKIYRDVLSEMYITLMSNQSEYYANKHNLTKAGRRKMREYLDMLPDVPDIEPPDDSQTDGTRE